jgi:acetyl-CoA C-acetyltransferase/acetyl-CoA acyltransferase
MARWYATAIENARLNPQAQEHANRVVDLEAQGLVPPDGRAFCDHINVYHCSKFSDGAAAVCVSSSSGLERLGIPRAQAVEIVGLGQATANLTLPPPDPTDLTTSRVAIDRARAVAGVVPGDIGVFEVHDCFSITGILSLEALSLAAPGEGADLVLAGAHARAGAHPTNTGGGLVGYGHPTGASGVRMAVDLWRQLTGRADAFQVNVTKDHGQMISMGGDDKTAVSLVLRH